VTAVICWDRIAEGFGGAEKEGEALDAGWVIAILAGFISKFWTKLMQ